VLGGVRRVSKLCTDPVLDVELLEIGDLETFANMVNERLGKPLIPLVGAVSPVALGPI
jgi:hypothetical protein